MVHFMIKAMEKPGFEADAFRVRLRLRIMVTRTVKNAHPCHLIALPVLTGDDLRHLKDMIFWQTREVLCLRRVTAPAMPIYIP
ncbi:hypothetical protein DA792_00255 (plasmid) [Celeribacter baekdonensis]|uniref:Uncharacterized protein n=1 Tax=Celeribacter baekdonensis TaxID=875171 RepID=A0A2R4LXS1_9RHOB|nr:hypothetical protein DA792_00255 [Celeribacter baekdonensis]